LIIRLLRRISVGDLETLIQTFAITFELRSFIRKDWIRRFEQVPNSEIEQKKGGKLPPFFCGCIFYSGIKTTLTRF